jgi:hypothetical protein
MRELSHRPQADEMLIFQALLENQSGLSRLNR